VCEVAGRVGVSVTSVSHVINGSRPAIDHSAGLYDLWDGQKLIGMAWHQMVEFKYDMGLTIAENCLVALSDVDAVLAKSITQDKPDEAERAAKIQ
jgi:hypothetical protein